MKPFKVFLHLFIALFLVSQTSTAQTYIPPSLPDSLLDTEDTITAISCDMLACPVIGGHIMAVAYSYTKGTGHESWLHVKYTNASGTVDSWDKRIANAYNIDVVVADNKLTPGGRYNVFYVYNEDVGGVATVKYRRYTFGVSSGGFFSVNDAGGTQIGHGGRPRVDVFPDAVDTFSNGIPKMYDFVATWNANDDTFHLATGYVNSSTTVVTHAIPINVSYYVRMFDVGAQYDLDSGRYVAHLFYADGFPTTPAVDYLRHATVNMSATTPVVLSIDTLISDTLGDNKANSVVEAPGLYTRSLGGASWGGLIMDLGLTASTGRQVIHYNSLTNYGYVFTPALLPLGGFPINVAIAVGLGLPKGPGKIGNENFVVGWQDPVADKYYSQYVNISTGTRNNPTDYYEICSTSTTRILALSSSSNRGDSVLAAWWDSTDIYWKFAGNSPGYKPAHDDIDPDTTGNGAWTYNPLTGKIEETGTYSQGQDQSQPISKLSQKKTRIYPNPARSELYIDGSTGAAYRISDVAGRMILSGTVSPGPIDIRDLGRGCYIIHIEGQGVRDALRFTKY